MSDFPIVELTVPVGASPETILMLLVQQLVLSGRIQPEHVDRFISQILRREILGSTGVGRGVALPHSKSDVIGDVVGVIARLANPIIWPGALDGQPVGIICLWATPASDPEAAIRVLQTIARQIRDM